MSQTAERLLMSEAEYLAFERVSREKHQFVRGEVFAMAGASLRHNALVSRLVRHLGNALDGTRCQVFPSDLKVYVAALETFTYPDVTVVCGRPALYEGAGDVLTNPKVIVEVLSEGTERYDRGEKAEGYRATPSVSDHVLVSQHKAHVEHFTRREDGSWTLREASAGGSVVLLSVSVTLDVDALYAGVFDLPA
ncbi:MAG: Uma2 family endonuclease [Myxococcales bacterium]|nr:Uma2 family endonuclease [Myxococcales bacterium]